MGWQKNVMLWLDRRRLEWEKDGIKGFSQYPESPRIFFGNEFGLNWQTAHFTEHWGKGRGEKWWRSSNPALLERAQWGRED